ncbi:hypothetical protein D3C80_1466810 [compost metagenome]
MYGGGIGLQLVRRQLLAAQNFRIPQNGGKRGPEFMGHLGNHFLLEQLPLHLLRTVAEDEQAVAVPDLLRALDNGHVQGQIHFALIIVEGNVA